jgi:HTH-like domain
VNCYPFIEAEKAGRRNVSRACALLKVSRAALYQHLSGPSRRDQQDAELTGQIRDVHQESKGRYGAPRVHAELRLRGRQQDQEGSLTESSALSVKAGQPHCENTRPHKSQKSCTERLTQRGIAMRVNSVASRAACAAPERVICARPLAWLTWRTDSPPGLTARRLWRRQSLRTAQSRGLSSSLDRRDDATAPGGPAPRSWL